MLSSTLIHDPAYVQSTGKAGEEERQMGKRDKSRGEVIPLARRITLFIFSSLDLCIYMYNDPQYRRNVAFVLHRYIR